MANINWCKHVDVLQGGQTVSNMFESVKRLIMFGEMFDDQTRCPNRKMCARQAVFDRQTFPIWAELSILGLSFTASLLKCVP